MCYHRFVAPIKKHPVSPLSFIAILSLTGEQKGEKSLKRCRCIKFNGLYLIYIMQMAKLMCSYMATSSVKIIDKCDVFAVY